ncbi:MAG: glycine cleavage system aminomethyltransferase GcvT [Verrucomicrobiales bacterium]|nr:glycine cleavage system aminomethyltransferase GcvT [Verrucomicrobiales bacterium]
MTGGKIDKIGWGVESAGMGSDIEKCEVKQTPLAARHVALGAKMAAFAGWEMPIQYAGIMAEHLAVRSEAGVFDISHMGQIWVRGEAAAQWLNGLLTNDVAILEVAQGQYTLMLNEKGGVIDDLIIYRSGENEFFLVVNASCIELDWAWLQKQATDVEGIELENESDEYAGLAIQGPRAVEVWAAMAGEGGGALPARNHIVRVPAHNGDDLILCRTGYTGEDGFELFCPAASAQFWWDAALAAGCAPCGLGARDTLRLEKGYPLNGSDLDQQHTPLEAGLGFFVKMDKGDFVGREVLLEQKEKGLLRRLCAIRMVVKGPPPRPHYAVCVTDGGEQIAELSSGGLSPSLKQGIGMAYLPKGYGKVGTELEIDVRGKRYAAEVVKKPFV